MKKVLVLFGALSIAMLPALAYIPESETASVETLKKQGYSESALKALDYVNATSQGSDVDCKYVRYYKTKKGNIVGRGYSSLKRYFDPAQDDGEFGHHQVEFSNTWQGDEPRYASPLAPAADMKTKKASKTKAKKSAKQKVQSTQQQQRVENL